mmetsp:Transcript_28667/g.66488  ORF Transcript_28667/g.66488 Transcript_28667/m.66488 type:complete len:682 (+) Transcript_28667:79-2124(+)
MGQSCNVGSTSRSGATNAVFTLHGRGNLPAYPTATDVTIKEVTRQKDESQETLRAPVHTGAFRVTVVKPQQQDSSTNGQQLQQGWRHLYALGPMLGDGISAKVFEAEALTQTIDLVEAGSAKDSAFSMWKHCTHGHSCFSERGRRVAIKKFHRAGSRAFRKELNALQRVGVHPHVLRLLQSYEGFDGEDVLVLEYCDGATVYDLYAREFQNGGLPERLITKLVRQLLLALEHIAACGVEHQDVKPENMMLYDVSVQNAHAELKLGDFGWATVNPNGQDESTVPPSTLATGAGSLWYAPPELNPPVKGLPVDCTPPKDGTGRPIRGRSDIWSVGVVAYLLLVGHNPFNAALEKKDPQEVDNAVLRLAAQGNFNQRSDKWMSLSLDAREFITGLLKVEMRNRPSATEAAHHPFLQKRPGAKGASGSVFFHGPVPEANEREAAWDRLDGFQQLAWIAIVRAVSEPEIDRQTTAAALDAMKRGKETSVIHDDGSKSKYMLHLAKELVSAPVGQWLLQRPVWSEVLRLAFGYLDVDGDGILAAKDLALHIAVLPPTTAHATNEPIMSIQDAQFMAVKWVAKWQPTQASTQLKGQVKRGIEMQGFRAALVAGQPAESLFEPVEIQNQQHQDGSASGGARDAQPLPGSFRGVMPGAGDQDEEEISWADLRSRAGSNSRHGHGHGAQTL